jgi:broad specificity phosphatase PhoE
VEIYLIRHGETDWNKERRLQGHSDIPLNEFGRELAVETAKSLAGLPFDRAFSSPLKRAYETAQILLAGRNVPLETDERLIEMGFGDCEGGAFDRPKTDAEHPLHDFFCRPQCFCPRGGAESFQEVMARGQAFLRERIVPLEESCSRILIVAHGAFNRCLLSAVGPIPLEKFWEIGLPNCAASILSLENGQLRILEPGKVYYGTPVNAKP